MKIPKSVRVLFQELQPHYVKLKDEVDKLIIGRKERRWHYESRVKEEESFALKLETGRVKDVRKPEDFFGCTLVVENKARIADAEKLVATCFEVAYRRPKNPKITHLVPYSFDFDDLRLYVKWKDDPAVRPGGLQGTLFEVQIKTFLQHAWGIATHDFIYKAEDVQWSTSRIAFQVRAMLENAELSIAEANKLTDSAMLDRCDAACRDLQLTIADLKKRWEPAHLPSDLRRLADNVLNISDVLKVYMQDVWTAVDEATAAGEGAKLLNVSPYAAIVAALIRKFDVKLFEPLSHARGREWLFVPLEVALPKMPRKAQDRIIQPPVITT